MVEKDVEMFLEACELKGLSMKTIGSYEQTLRLFMQHLYKNGIERTENVTHLTIQGYIQEIRRRGKYTAVTNQDARNYPENRPDYGKQVSDVTINNYLRNLRVFLTGASMRIFFGNRRSSVATLRRQITSRWNLSQMTTSNGC
jgi:integrase/recombinase XerD